MKYNYLIVLSGKIIKTPAGFVMPDIYDGIYQGGKERLDTASQLFMQGKVEKIIVVGGKIEGSSKENSAVMQKYLLQQNIPENNIIQVPSKSSTLGNAAAIKKYFSRKQIEKVKIGLLTSKYHLPRAMKIFEKYGLNFEPIAAEEMIMNPLDIKKLYQSLAMKKRIKLEKRGLKALEEGRYKK